MDYREQEVRKAHLDSCNWILEHKSYTEWIAKRRGILGIKGKPGSGKSTLMKKIFRLFREFEDAKSIQLAFFFHRRGTSLQHTQIGMFRSLLHQLLKQIPSAGQAFYSLCERKRRWQGDSGKDWEWRLEELREAFSSTLLTTAKDHAVRIFIDALDEAGDDQAQEIVSYLYDMYEELFKLDAAVAVCFSCRHFPILAVNDGFEIVLEENNQKDIEEYASAELKKKMGNRGSSLDALRADIVSKASGVFMWVALVVPLVARQYNNGKSLETIRQTLNKVPSQLEEVYKHILTKVVDWDDRRQTLHLLQWIYLAERPLSVTELRHALASDDSVIKPAQYSCQKSKEFVENDDIMKRLIVSLSGGLAEVKHHGSSNHGQQDMVQFIHQSVNDFLSKDKFRCLELHEPVDLIGQGYHRLSRSCINYLQLHEVRHRTEVLDKWNDYYDRDKEKVKARLIVDIPLIEYATEFWFIHAEKAESYNIPQQNLLRRLKWPSNEFFLIWIKTFHAINELNNRRAGRGATLIHVAAASNLITALKAMLEKGANIESEDEEGNRPIHYAARWGQDRIVSFLLDAGAGIGDKNKDGKTALERAAGAGHEKVVDLLLGGGEGGLKFRVNGALLAAAEANEEKVMWLLLERGADANVQGGFYGSVLQAASFNGHEAIVRVLLERGAEANTQGGIHGNALQAAASQGNEAIVRALLERGAEVNAKGGYYGYALQAAACNGHEAIVRLLLEQGAEVSAQGGHWGNALKAAESGRPRQIYAKIVELLLEYMSKQERLEYRASEWEDVFDDNESEGVACTKDWLE
jgi:ankyrin repeat domain-containing protein 50